MTDIPMLVLIGLAVLLLGFVLGRATAHVRMPLRFQKGTPEARAGMSAIRGDAVRAKQERVEKRKERIMALAKKQERITNDEVEDMFCVSNATAWNYLEQLENEKLLIQEGRGRGIFYRPK